jgi:outer membrane protein assembly factor BamD (BamD/ComL family)
LVYEAARALRNEGDPAHAARALDDYFKRYPHGALSEEAQALAIDVAVARGDARAKTLATRYLAAYPNGHFRPKAERVLAAE